MSETPTLPAPPDPEELARREAAADRRATRSRVAELVALVTIVAGALTQLATHIPDLTALVRALRGVP